MIIRTFTAPNLDKALWLMNEDLGQNAVILKTSFSIASASPDKPRKYVEITAAIDSAMLGSQNSSGGENDVLNSSNSSDRIKNNKCTKHASVQFEMQADTQYVEVIGW